MAVTIWSSDYQNAHLCHLVMAGLASVATKKNTSPAQVWFCKSNGDDIWTEPVLVGETTSSKSAHVHERTDATLIVTNGIDLMWQSTDGGRSWQQL